MTISPLPGIDANARSLGSMSYWISGLGTGDNDALAFGEAGAEFEISSSDGSIGNNTSTMSSTDNNRANVCLWQRSVYYNTNSSELWNKIQTTWNKVCKLIKDVLALITSFIYRSNQSSKISNLMCKVGTSCKFGAAYVLLTVTILKNWVITNHKDLTFWGWWLTRGELCFIRIWVGVFSNTNARFRQEFVEIHEFQVEVIVVWVIPKVWSKKCRGRINLPSSHFPLCTSTAICIIAKTTLKFVQDNH